MPSRTTSFSARVLAVVAAVSLATTVAPAAPASADAEGHTSWSERAEDAGGAVRSYAWDPTAREAFVNPSTRTLGTDVDNLDVLAGDGTRGTRLRFEPPRGQQLVVGTTYRVRAVAPSATAGRLWVGTGLDNVMCGEREDDWPTWGRGDEDGRPPAIGTFTIGELVRDAAGRVERLSATYDVGCQVVGGPQGLAGSLSYHASAPASAVPAVQPVPGPLRDVRLVNSGPSGSGTNASSFTWTKPAGAQDTIIEFGWSADADLPAVVGKIGLAWTGTASSFRDPYVEGIGGRAWRLTPRSATGRLGPSTVLRVDGTRIATDYRGVRATVGRSVTVRGRMSEAHEHGVGGDPMAGPAVAGAVVRLCRVTSHRDAQRDCVTSTRTDAAGRFALSVVPDGDTDYQVVSVPTTTRYAETSYAVAAAVTPFTDIAVAAGAGERSAMTRFTSSKARAGAKGTARLQRLAGAQWRTVATKSLGNGRGRVAFVVRGARAGEQFRVVKPADRRHTTGVSRVVRLR